MRLIDADKITYFNCLAKTGNAMCCHAEGITCKEGIDMQPTVNAIPIEWLNKRAEEIAFAYWTSARNKMTLPLNELPLLIDQIIGEWEKENGKNI